MAVLWPYRVDGIIRRREETVVVGVESGYPGLRKSYTGS